LRPILAAWRVSSRLVSSRGWKVWMRGPGVKGVHSGGDAVGQVGVIAKLRNKSWQRNGCQLLALVPRLIASPTSHRHPLRLPDPMPQLHPTTSTRIPQILCTASQRAILRTSSPIARDYLKPKECDVAFAQLLQKQARLDKSARHQKAVVTVILGEKRDRSSLRDSTQ